MDREKWVPQKWFIYLTNLEKLFLLPVLYLHMHDSFLEQKEIEDMAEDGMLDTADWLKIV